VILLMWIGLFSGERQTLGWFSDLRGSRTLPTSEKTLATHKRLTDFFYISDKLLSFPNEKDFLLSVKLGDGWVKYLSAVSTRN